MAGEKPSPPPLKPQLFNCPQCGAQLSVTARGQTLVVACGSCASIVDAQSEEHQILSQGRKLESLPLIPIGRRGKLHGHMWQVIGYMVRFDKASSFEWSEYLLYNPRQGFRWLIEADGHWNYTVPMHIKGEIDQFDSHVALAFGRKYSLFHKGTAIVKAVIGEFYWRVKAGDSVGVSDFIRPPELLSVEKDYSEVNWSLSEYIEGSVVKQAFDVTGDWPWAKGVAPNQPGLFQGAYEKLWKTTGLLLATLLAVQIVTSILSSERNVFELVGTFVQGTTEEVVSDPFELTGWPKLFTIELSADVQNSWLSLDSTLFNVETGRVFEFEPGVEFYSGYDGEHWSEGSRFKRFKISAVPAGIYKLMLRPQADLSAASTRYRVTAYSGGAIWSNFWVASILMILIPTILAALRISRESTRWSESDYGPSNRADNF